MLPLPADRVGLMAAVLLLVVASRAAQAQPAGGERAVRLEAPDCEAAPVAVEAFLASLRVELAGSGLRCCVSGAPPEGAESNEVRIALAPCDPSGEETAVAVDDPSRGGTVSRRVALADVLPAARPRALALAVAELVRGVGQRSPGSDPPLPPPPAPPEAPRPRAAPGVFGLSAWAAGELRVHPGRETTLAGGRIALVATRGAVWAALDLHGAGGSPEADLGEIGIRLFGAGLSVGPRLALGPIAIEAGPSLELGWAWIEGRTHRADVEVGSGSGLTAAAGGRISIEAPRSAALRLRAHLEGGAVLRGVTAEINGTPAAGATGAYLLFGVGAAFVFLGGS